MDVKWVAPAIGHDVHLLVSEHGQSSPIYLAFIFKTLAGTWTARAFTRPDWTEVHTVQKTGFLTLEEAKAWSAAVALFNQR